MRWLIIILTLLFTFQPLHAQTATLIVDDVVRTYHLHVPRRLDSPAPLLIVLHGGGGHGRQMQRFTGFDRIANREGFIVVYPDGIDNAWNDGRIFDHERTADDVTFIAALIDHLIATQPIDPNQVYATGISNGGFMSFRLACELADRIAGVAPVTATLAEDIAPDCQPEQPLKVLVINGTLDPLVPYAGGTVRLADDGTPRGEIRSTTATLRFWADHNECASEAVTTDLPNKVLRDQTRAQLTTYTRCREPVQLLTIINGGHTWPGGSQYLPALLIGRTSRDIDASEFIWTFFAAPIVD